MKARIVKDGGFWVGEVGLWVNMVDIGRGILEPYETLRWKSITKRCHTKFGAKMELMKWKREHTIKEFEL